MPEPLIISLEAIRTDGWFERIGETIGSFQALCEIIGPRFFAFAMITGARITALTVDRRNPDQTVVDFTVGGDEADLANAEVQQLTLAEFRRRLVSALLMDEPFPPPPRRATDLEAAQLHVGVRFLLLAPLYGYALHELTVNPTGSVLRLAYDGVEQSCNVEEFRARLRGHVREELERQSRGNQRGTIDLNRVAEAEEAAAVGEPLKVVEILGAWPAPLAIFLRTPEAQTLSLDARAMIAKALGLLGSACFGLGDAARGEEILRLGVQYAGELPIASNVYLRMGVAVLADGRPGEAIAALRRAAKLGAAAEAWPHLAAAFYSRGRLLAAWGICAEAEREGKAEAVEEILAQIKAALGPHAEPWRQAVHLLNLEAGASAAATQENAQKNA